MLAARVMTGLSLVAAFLVVVVLDEKLSPWYPFWFVMCSVGVTLGAREITALLGRTGAKPSGNAVVGGVLLIVFANWAPHVLGLYDTPTDGRFDPLAPIHVMSWSLWAYAAIVMSVFLAQSVQFDRPGATTATIAGTLLAVAYVGLLGSFVIQMRWLDGKFHGLIPLVYLVATTKMSDTGAYTLGRIAGRRKLWPRLSPNKTVEGALGGTIGGVAAALIVTAVARYALGAESLSWLSAIGFGLVVGTAAQLGDLMESMIKRDCDRKDASDTLPGFGGVLDVLDSVLFAGPVAYGYWVLMGP
jgi:phosphatidate cytidylyltransferase